MSGIGPIGPQLPPHLKLDTSESVSDDDDDLYGPQLPPHLKQKKCTETFSSNETAEDFMQKKIGRNEEEASSDGDDEVIGPLPNMESSSTFLELEKRAALLKNKSKNLDKESSKAKREEWMTVLPELEKKNFGLGPRTFNRTEKPEIKGRGGWTATPSSSSEQPEEEADDSGDGKDEYDERLQFLEEKRNKELEKVVEQHNKHKRSKSLLNEHKMKMRKKDEPKERKPFDRDEDLKINKMDDAKRKVIIKKSQEINSRFKIGSKKFL